MCNYPHIRRLNANAQWYYRVVPRGSICHLRKGLDMPHAPLHARRLTAICIASAVALTSARRSECSRAVSSHASAAPVPHTRRLLGCCRIRKPAHPTAHRHRLRTLGYFIRRYRCIRRGAAPPRRRSRAQRRLINSALYSPRGRTATSTLARAAYRITAVFGAEPAE